MRLKVALPTKMLVDEEAGKVTAEAENGSFTILPRHADYVATLVPGILSFESTSGKEEFLAVNGGVLVKKGDEVIVSSPNGIRSDNLGGLESTMKEKFSESDEHERKARTALARLETDFMRRFLEITG